MLNLLLIDVKVGVACAAKHPPFRQHKATTYTWIYAILPGMLNKRTLAIIALQLVLAACASPNVDTSAPTFNDKQYTADLNNCQGGTTLYVALNGLGGAIIGSAIGAAEGAYYGAISGDAPEGAIIGAAVGTVIGVFAGATEPFQKQEQKVSQCLTEKGYVLGAST